MKKYTKIILNQITPFAFTAILLFFTIGCSDDETTIDEGNEEEIEETSETEDLPVTIDFTEWAVIHQNNFGTKESTHPGPEGSNIQSEEFLNNPPVLMIQGSEYLYYQVSQSPNLYALDPENIQAGPVHQIATGASFPNMGGGLVDDNGNNWWNVSGKLVRYNSTLTVTDVSENYAIEGGGAVPPTNGLTLLTERRIMASSVLNNAWIMSTEKDLTTNKFAILDTIDFQEFTYNGVAIWENETTFNPRPIIDNDGFIYLVGGDWLVKIAFDSSTDKLNREIVWAFNNPTAGVSDLILSNPIIINNNICISTTAEATSFEEVYVLNLDTGNLLHSLTPFPAAIGRDALHTLGGIQSSNLLFAIGNSPDGDAGVAGYDLNTGLEIWPFVSLKNISEAFCISSANNKIYLSYSEDTSSPFIITSIDITSGIAADIYEDASITTLPRGQLGLVSSAGLIYPTPNGIVRLWN
jgi:outer membrane protein assembly factor BamB